MKAIRFMETKVQPPVRPTEDKYKEAVDRIFTFKPYWEREESKDSFKGMAIEA